MKDVLVYNTQIKILIKFTLSFLLLSFYSPTAAQKISKKDLLSDVNYLNKALKKTHINLYAYTSKEEFDSNFKVVKKSIVKDSFTTKEVITVLQKIVAKVYNSHTNIPFPAKSYIKFAKSGGKLFPLELAFEDNKVLVRKNWSSHTKINLGDEITSINGIPIQQILEKIYPVVSAERLYFKLAQIENLSFPRLYWQIFDEQKIFTVGIQNKANVNYIKLTGVDAIAEFETKRDNILKYDRVLKFYDKVAYIQPGNFGGELKKYQKFIDSSFAEIKSKGAKNLIVDLRNHPGGDDVFGDYLVSYFAKKPFKWASNFQLKSSKLLKKHVLKTMKDTSNAYRKSILNHKDGTVFDYDFDEYQPQLKSKRFNGNVYVLVNRQSYSQSTVTAAQIQDYGFGTIVGEETSESPNLYASIFQFNLPKTKVVVNVSKGKITRASGDDNKKGVIPDILIKDHLLDEKDEILKGLLDRLKHK